MDKNWKKKLKIKTPAKIPKMNLEKINLFQKKR